MADIKCIDGMTPDQIAFEVNRGGKFVCYRYCFSAMVVTVMRGTDIYFVRAGENRILKGLPWTLLTLLLGWWGIPWGPIRSVQSVWINCSLGIDLTANVVSAMNLQNVHWDTASAS